MMLVVGLTGSMGMGKSTAAAYLAAQGIPVCDADALVHELYAGPAAATVEAAFPGTTADGVVDREKLGAVVAGKPDALRKLEAVVHPLVREGERAFLLRAFDSGARIAVLEIPLLFETGGDKLVDATIVVSASPEVQRQRVLERRGMSEARFKALLARQMPDKEKRRRADFVVDTNGALSETQSQLDAIVAKLKRRTASAFRRHWA